MEPTTVGECWAVLARHNVTRPELPLDQSLFPVAIAITKLEAQRDQLLEACQLSLNLARLIIADGNETIGCRHSDEADLEVEELESLVAKAEKQVKSLEAAIAKAEGGE